MKITIVATSPIPVVQPVTTHFTELELEMKDNTGSGAVTERPVNVSLFSYTIPCSVVKVN
jgi:hypothetical protein